MNFIGGECRLFENFENSVVFVTNMPNFIYVQNSLKSQIDHVPNALSLTQIIWDKSLSGCKKHVP